MTDFDRLFMQDLAKKRAERARKAKEHKQHIKRQKEEAEYNNQVNGHHTNRERNISRKLRERGGDLPGRYSIADLFENRDWEAVKKLADKKGGK